MKRHTIGLVWCGLLAATVASPAAVGVVRTTPPVPITPATSWPTSTSPAAPRVTTARADYLVGHQWILAGGQVSRRERMALLIAVDDDAGVVELAVLPEDPGDPMAAPAVAFIVDEMSQQGTVLTLRATRHRQHGGTHTLQLTRQGTTVTIHEVWRDRFGHETRAAIRVATLITRMPIDDVSDGLDGLARRLDAERRLGG